MNKILTLTIIFKEDEPIPNTWGSDAIVYEVRYNYKNQILEIWHQGSFGDWTLEKRFQDRRGRGITEDEMLEDIKEIANMNFNEFKKKVLEHE